jgi:hypothetical protein
MPLKASGRVLSDPGTILLSLLRENWRFARAIAVLVHRAAAIGANRLEQRNRLANGRLGPEISAGVADIDRFPTGFVFLLHSSSSYVLLGIGPFHGGGPVMRHLFAACVACALAPSVQAEIVLYSNLGPGDSFAGGVHNVNSGYSEPAAPFVAQTGAFLARIDLPVVDLVEIGPGSILTLTLWSNGLDQPGTPLEVVTATNLPIVTPVLSSIAAAGTTFLKHGETYWLSLSARTAGQLSWHANDTGVGEHAITFDRNRSEPWQLFPATPQGAFRVVGIPEPTTLALFTIAFLSIPTWHLARNVLLGFRPRPGIRKRT